MRRLRLGVGIGVVLLLIAGAVAPTAATAAGGRRPSANPGASAQTSTPIKHFVSVMQEMRSFDSYFGTYPKADGIPTGVCMPALPTPGGPSCVRPFSIGTSQSRRLLNDHATFEAQYANGAMNGFVTAQSTRGVTNPLPMDH